MKHNVQKKVEDFYEKLNEKLDTILKNFQYYDIPVDDTDMAYRRFDTINNRGGGLKEVDLIKTKIFTHLYNNIFKGK